MLIVRHRSGRLHARAFTLVEMLVVVSVLIVLAALVFSMTRKSIEKAKGATCLSRLRQVGTVLVTKANENNLRLKGFRGGSGNFEYRPYMLVRDTMGLPENPRNAHYETMKGLMFCPSAPEPETIHWNTYGMNFNNSEEAGVKWVTEKVKDDQGRTSSVLSLHLSTVPNAADFVLLADSCRADGQQVFRLGGADLPGLRHGGRANAVFLDGSTRSLSQEDLGKLGFEKAYDTSSTPPTQVTLPTFNRS